jgi:hypothetical protein
MSNADDVIAADIMAVNAIIFRVTPSYRNSQFHLHQGIRSKNSNENLHRAAGAADSPLPGVGCAVDELQGSAVRVAEIRTRTIDDTASVEKSHALVRQGMQKFAADDLCVEAGASLGITDRYGEMRYSRELHHECLLVL